MASDNQLRVAGGLVRGCEDLTEVLGLVGRLGRDRDLRLGAGLPGLCVLGLGGCRQHLGDTVVEGEGNSASGLGRLKQLRVGGLDGGGVQVGAGLRGGGVREQLGEVRSGVRGRS